MKAILYIISLFLLIGGISLFISSSDLPKKFADEGPKMALSGVLMIMIGGALFYGVHFIKVKEE